MNNVYIEGMVTSLSFGIDYIDFEVRCEGSQFANEAKRVRCLAPIVFKSIVELGNEIGLTGELENISDFKKSWHRIRATRVELIIEPKGFELRGAL